VNIQNIKVRQYIYGIFATAGLLLIGYGILNVEQYGLWLAVIGAALGLTNALALNNTPNGKHEAP
jgi:hypothetical protein